MRNRAISVHFGCEGMKSLKIPEILCLVNGR